MDVMAIAANGMQHDLLRMETISQNMANVLTPGYKKQVLSGSSFSQQVAGGLADAAAASPATLSIDAAPGTLRYTANPQDVAIEGTEFFEIAAPQGPAYTRQGGFHTDVRGRLVGQHGMPVMGVSGEIVLSGPYVIDSNGDVRQGDRVVARLKMVRFANPEALQPLGSGTYAQGAARLAEQGAAPSVRVGYQENSNVSSPQEMVRLTETVRHFEALQKIMQGYDDSLEKTIRKLGDF
ncbi:flagellar hook-basal body protein [Duganella sp. HH105]|uniref:flagellar hook-basal body protein n=1 Tax=Duganella sp. HH105 TaxID=1781067 RepID=UPI000877B616|nr:flagellar hook basal-body protein [Duganella sp. HH105]OEZ54740.1 flagellar basal-body rod protein FlgG [Duganella sp. HH105]